MTKLPPATDATPEEIAKASNPADIEVEVLNPRYEGATIGMVVKAMLRRPRKADQEGDGKQSRSARTSEGTLRR